MQRPRTAALAMIAVASAVARPQGLAVFTLVRGGPSDAHYESFVNSRRSQPVLDARRRLASSPSLLDYRDMNFITITAKVMSLTLTLTLTLTLKVRRKVRVGAPRPTIECKSRT